MIDQELLNKLPKKYHPIIVELERTEDSYIIKLQEGYEFKNIQAENGTYKIGTFVMITKMLKEDLNVDVTSERGGKREGSGRKNMGYKMVSIRMTEEEKFAVKKFLEEYRKAKNTEQQ